MNDLLTKQEAIKALEDGHKLSHRFFQPHEYIYLKDNKIFMEDDYSIDIETFWQDRNSLMWNKDWYII